MRKNKICKITTFDIITSLLGSTMIIIIFIVFLIWFISTNDLSNMNIWIEIIPFSVVGLIASYYGFYPFYLCWTYYQREKNITVFIDYEKKEFQYIKQEKDIQYIRFEDIVAVERHVGKGIGVGYHKIILNDGNFIIITTLLVGGLVIDRIVPDIYSKIEYSHKLLLSREY